MYDQQQQQQQTGYYQAPAPAQPYYGQPVVMGPQPVVYVPAVTPVPMVDAIYSSWNRMISAALLAAIGAVLIIVATATTGWWIMKNDDYGLTINAGLFGYCQDIERDSSDSSCYAYGDQITPEAYSQLKAAQAFAVISSLLGSVGALTMLFSALSRYYQFFSQGSRIQIGIAVAFPAIMGLTSILTIIIGMAYFSKHASSLLGISFTGNAGYSLALMIIGTICECSAAAMYHTSLVNRRWWTNRAAMAAAY